MYLIVGLGNPGKEYEGTRHNIGFELVEKLAKENGISLDKAKFKGIYGEGRIGSEKVFILKPTTYMNNSGESLVEFKNYYKIPDENIIVVADDIDIPFGSLRIKKKGSAGTHNGLKSIVNLLGTKDFPRMKVGVGQKAEKQDLASFVLGRFNKEEKVYIDEAVDLGVKALETYVKDGIDEAMNRYNNKGKKAQE